jgi:hypothetical protein
MALAAALLLPLTLSTVQAQAERDDEDRPRPEAREGDPPREGDRPLGGRGPRDGERPRFGPRDGEDRPRGPEARDGERPPGRPDGFGFGPPNPILEALDSDRNGEISSSEIDMAVVALKTLDKNKDGKLDREELRPEFGDRGFGGPPPGGFGGRGGFGAREGSPEENAAFIDRVMQRDANDDGKISKDELPEFMQRMMEFADADGDGVLTRDEIERMADRRRGPPEGRGPGRPPGGEDPGRPDRPERPDAPERPERPE